MPISKNKVGVLVNMEKETKEKLDQIAREHKSNKHNYT